MLDECGGLDHLEALQQHPNDDVYEKAHEIILLCFVEAQDDEDQKLAPATEAERAADQQQLLLVLQESLALPESQAQGSHVTTFHNIAEA